MRTYVGHELSSGVEVFPRNISVVNNIRLEMTNRRSHWDVGRCHASRQRGRRHSRMTRDRGMQFHIGSPDSDIDEPADFGSPPRRPSPSAPPPSADPLHSTPDSNLAPDGTATDNAVNYNDVNSHSPSAALTLSSSPPAPETHPAPAPTAPVDNRGDTDSDEDSTWVSRNRKRKQERQPSTRIPSASPADVTSGAVASSPPQSTGPAAGAVYVEEDETVRNKRHSSRFLEVPAWTMGHHLTDPEEQEQTSDLANADVTPEVPGLTRLSSQEEDREGQKISNASEASAKSSSSEEFPNKASSRRRTSRQRSTSDTPGSGEERSSPKPSTPTAGPKFFLDVSSERTSSGNDRPPQKKLSWSLPLTDDEATPSLAPDGGEYADHSPRSPRHSTGKVEDDVTDDDPVDRSGAGGDDVRRGISGAVPGQHPCPQAGQKLVPAFGC
ncbi:hypothetical protein C0Q70_15610 [Pomacea canaliculata]|uniref:Uncharacterized protein n=1 Tax=Pomacea canaliculata TaxID=400727 RepID=A0A2T7NVC0_POMCA|nr:hypothetical protein C0Q70_15610 [Pomacea canaliculata]